MLSPHRATVRLGQNPVVDPISNVLDTAAAPLRRYQPVKDALNGTWLEHPVHPLMIALPIGAWVAGTAFDLLGKRHQQTADSLVGFGLLTAVPTAAAGLAQWVDASQPARRIGAVHAAANTVSAALQLASWRSRRNGQRTRAILLSQAAMGLTGFAGYLGGHLSYALGYGVDHTAFETRIADWTSTGVRAEEVQERDLRLAEAGGERILLTRIQGEVRAFAERCTHEAGPLSEGKVVGEGADTCVECPWHGSQFRLTDGQVKASPATVPARRYDVREAAGLVEVRFLD